MTSSSTSSSFSPRTLWLLSLAPASVLYTTFLYAIVLLFLAITYMAQLQAMERRSDEIPTVIAA